MYQARKKDNGNFVFKYLGGVSIMETPFFLVGNFMAMHTKWEAGGFSPPYQYSVVFGAII